MTNSRWRMAGRASVITFGQQPDRRRDVRRHEQRAGPRLGAPGHAFFGLDRVVDVGPRLQQDADDVEAAFPRGKK